MSDEFETYVSSAAEDTTEVWSHLLLLCKQEVHIGFGKLDSFLSGPDLERRLDLVEEECKSNEWLRLELKDTLGLDQSSDWSDKQMQRVKNMVEKTPD